MAGILTDAFRRKDYGFLKSLCANSSHRLLAYSMRPPSMFGARKAHWSYSQLEEGTDLGSFACLSRLGLGEHLLLNKSRR